MMDLWTLFVVNMFQGFWLAVLCLAILFYIILMMGNVSQLTCYNFLSIFILAMAIGYGYDLIGITLTILILVIHVGVIPRWINS